MLSFCSPVGPTDFFSPFYPSNYYAFIYICLFIYYVTLVLFCLLYMSIYLIYPFSFKILCLNLKRNIWNSARFVWIIGCVFLKQFEDRSLFFSKEKRVLRIFTNRVSNEIRLFRLSLVHSNVRNLVWMNRFMFLF